MDALLILFLIFMAALGATMLYRNELIFKSKMKANNTIFAYVTSRLEAGEYDDNKSNKSWGILQSPSYNKMALNVFNWEFDKMINVEQRLMDIWK